MMSSAEPIATFKGSDFEYSEVAFRDNETLGLHVSYGQHPQTGLIMMIIRFVMTAPTPYAETAKFKHFTVRGEKTYNKDGKEITGKALNRVMIPLVIGGCVHSLRQIGDHFNVWKIMADWIAEQIVAEGYVLSVFDLPTWLRNTTPDPLAEVKLALELPKELPAPNEEKEQ